MKTKSLLELIRDYGQIRQDIGWLRYEIDDFEGSQESIEAERKRDKAVQKADGIMCDIRKLLGVN